MNKPTVCLDVIALVASRCGYNKGEIGPHGAHECTAHGATQRGFAARPQPRHPPYAQPVAPLRECHDGRPRLTPRSGADQGLLRAQGYPGGRTQHTGGETTQALPIPCDALPDCLSFFRLLPMASPPRDARQKLWI